MTAYSRDQWAVGFQQAYPNDYVRTMRVLNELQRVARHPILDEAVRLRLDGVTPAAVRAAFWAVEDIYRRRKRQNASRVVMAALRDWEPVNLAPPAAPPAQPLPPPPLPSPPPPSGDVPKHVMFALLALVVQLMQENGIGPTLPLFGLMYDRTDLYLKQGTTMTVLQPSRAYWGEALRQLLNGLADQEQRPSVNLYVTGGQKMWLQKDTVTVRLL